MGCENCGNCEHGCGGQVLLLTEAELALLRRLGETPFLPAAAAYDRKAPVYLEERERSREEYAAAILGLAGKGLANFDYAAYRNYPLHGSMALTGWGQELLEQIEIQGIEE